MKQTLILLLVLCASSAGCKTGATNSTADAVSPSGQNSSPGSKLASSLLGTWTFGNGTLTFSPDSKFSMSGGNKGSNITGTYKFLDEQTIQFTTNDGIVGKPVQIVMLSPTKLQYTNSDKKVSIWQKTKE